MHSPKIIFDVERIRYPFTGLYYYCLYLSHALINQQNLHKPQLNLYAPENANKFFQQKIIYANHHFFHKYIMPFSSSTDIWHCTFQGSNYFPLKKINGIILTIHDFNFLYEKKDDVKILKYKNALQKKIDLADKIVTISEFVKQDLLKNFIINKNKISVIYNGCNVENDYIDEAPQTVPEAPFIFTIGVIAGKKNFHVLLPLLSNNDYLLIIAGIIIDESYKQKIISEAKKFNVEKRLIFTGSITDKQKKWYLKNCLVFVFPSVAEGFGLSVIEAMRFGKPTLLSKYTSLPEIGGKYAYYFNSFNADEMRQTLALALNDYSNNNKTEKIINWSKKFNWETTAKQHWQLYENLFTEIK